MKKILLTSFLLALLCSCSSDSDPANPDDPQIVPECLEPSNITVSNVTSSSAMISWTNTNTSSTFEVEYGMIGFSLGSGNLANVNTTTIELSGLNANTGYEVYVKAICSTDNESMYATSVTFTTPSPTIVADFLPNLSQLHLYSNMTDITPSDRAILYDLNTPLFTDYAHKQRLIALPEGTAMSYVDDRLPDFPDDTVISKTFFYYNNEQDESLGKQLIETRVLMKKDGVWEVGNYKWNEDQTDAVLDNTSSITPITYIDANGTSQNVNYRIPSQTDCTQCHSSAGVITPIGPKLRNLNGSHQLEDMIEAGQLTNLSDTSTITRLPSWDNTSSSLEDRARAYFDVNCAHCHSVGGTCEAESPLRLKYETPFNETQIYEQGTAIDYRMSFYYDTLSMPLIGTTMMHPEGYDLITEYINSL